LTFVLLGGALLTLLAPPRAVPSVQATTLSATCKGELHYKSQAGLMPAACEQASIVTTRAVVAAADIPFLSPPVDVMVPGWPQVAANVDLIGTPQHELALMSGHNFDPLHDETLQLLTNDGTAFTTLQQIAAGAHAEAVSALDVNLDDRVDIAAGGDGAVVFPQTLSSTAPLTQSVQLLQPGLVDALANGDFSGDLRADLAAVSPLSDSISLWHSTLSGSLLSRTLLFKTDGYSALRIGDFNNDGYDDLAALRGSGYLTDSVQIFLQQGDVFSAALTLSPETGGYLPHSLAAGDVNNDGLDDLVVTAGGEQPNAYLNVYLQGPSGLISTTTTLPAFSLPSAVVIADINHDGQNDVLTSHDGWRTLSIYLQNNSGALSPPLQVSLPYSSRYRPDALTVGDVDGNGSLDIAVVNRDPGLTLLTGASPAPVATILTPPAYATVLPGTLSVSGTASPDSVAVEVRIKGLTSWQPATLSGSSWSAVLPLTDHQRPIVIEARARDASGRYQAPPAQRRVSRSIVCYGLADNDGVDDERDVLTRVDSTTAAVTLVGRTRTDDMKAIAVNADDGRLYAVQHDRLGAIDMLSGLFTPIGPRLGKGKGAAGTRVFDRVMGITFGGDGTLYGVQRRGGSDKADLLFKINPETGLHVPDAFGHGTDYVQITGASVPKDIDDISFNLVDGKLYGIGNHPGRLVVIDTTSGQARSVGLTGVDNLEGLTFTPTRQLLASSGISGPVAKRNVLWEIDQSTGVAAAIGMFSSQRDYEALACLPAGSLLPPSTK